MLLAVANVQSCPPWQSQQSHRASLLSRLFSSPSPGNKVCDSKVHQDWRASAPSPLGMLDKLKSLAEGKKRKKEKKKSHWQAPLEMCSQCSPLTRVSQQPWQMSSKLGTVPSWGSLLFRETNVMTPVDWQVSVLEGGRANSEITDVEQLG